MNHSPFLSPKKSLDETILAQSRIARLTEGTMSEYTNCWNMFGQLSDEIKAYLNEFFEDLYT